MIDYTETEVEELAGELIAELESELSHAAGQTTRYPWFAKD